MKNLKVKLSAIALVLGLGTAFATVQHHDPSDRKWTKDPSSGLYSEITGQEEGTNYDCNESTARCSETYPEAVNPNTNPATGPLHVEPISYELGDFQ